MKKWVTKVVLAMSTLAQLTFLMPHRADAATLEWRSTSAKKGTVAQNTIVCPYVEQGL